MSKQLLLQLTAATLLSLLAMSCTNPLPQDKLDYVGDWQGGNITLLILEDGTLKYSKKQGSATTTINGTITEFHGDNFEGGVFVFTSTFVVSVPPHDDNGVWKMIVDGVEVTKR